MCSNSYVKGSIAYKWLIDTSFYYNRCNMKCLYYTDNKHLFHARSCAGDKNEQDRQGPKPHAADMLVSETDNTTDRQYHSWEHNKRESRGWEWVGYFRGKAPLRRDL